MAPKRKRKPKKWNSTVKTFGEVSRKLKQIDTFLGRLSKNLQRINWKKLPKKPKKNGNGDEEPGAGKNKWPP